MLGLGVIGVIEFRNNIEILTIQVMKVDRNKQLISFLLVQSKNIFLTLPLGKEQKIHGLNKPL